ncbi:MAG: class I SAM-dependent methyltransferase [Bryobacteraceae bacterium]
MKRTPVSVVLCAASWVFAAPAQTAHQHHPPQSADEYARALEDPARDAWQKPHEVLEALHLKGTETIADIGAGTCYFARRFARHAAQVYAVDIDAKLLEFCKKDAPANLKTVLSLPDDPKLADGASDIIFFCDVMHHIENRSAYLERVRRALRNGGRVVVIDFHKRPLPVGPGPEMKIARETMVEEFKQAGFQRVEEYDFLPYQYFLVFARIP